ncbi:hypothetical protein FACS1894122_06850 [Alphaproteobacteria bacterium]|nr:hypothetical protein FACS1894122_06850 [Alphaproteobacteria bacterium]
MNVRRLIEAVIGQLTERFNIQKFRTKNMWRLISKIRQKLYVHLIVFFINGAITFDQMNAP